MKRIYEYDEVIVDFIKNNPDSVWGACVKCSEKIGFSPYTIQSYWYGLGWYKDKALRNKPIASKCFVLVSKKKVLINGKDSNNKNITPFTFKIKRAYNSFIDSLKIK